MAENQSRPNPEIEAAKTFGDVGSSVNQHADVLPELKDWSPVPNFIYICHSITKSGYRHREAFFTAEAAERCAEKAIARGSEAWVSRNALAPLEWLETVEAGGRHG